MQSRETGFRNSLFFKNHIFDFLAIVFFIFLLIFFLYSIRFGIGHLDETLYISITQRFAKGERPLVDEWHVTQLSDLFLVLPYIFFRKINVGTDGIVLFMRQIFVIFHLMVFLIVYILLRHLRSWGFFAAAVFGSYVPHAMFAFNYYSMSIHALVLLCLILFLDKDASYNDPLSTTRLIISGILLSIAVIIQPPLAFLYVFYSIAVFIWWLYKKKVPKFCNNLDFFFNCRCWAIITVSVIACAVGFITYLSLISGLKNIIDNLPSILSDPYYNFSIFGNLWQTFYDKIIYPINFFGIFNIISLFVLCAFVLFLKHDKRVQYKYALFLLSNCILVCWFLHPIISKIFFHRDAWDNAYYFTVTPLPFFAFGFINYLLCEKKNPRLLLVCIVSVFSSALIDSFSTSCFGTCGIISVIPGILCFGEIIQEYKEDTHSSINGISKNKKKKGTPAKSLKRMNKNCLYVRISGVAFSVFLILTCFNVYLQSVCLLNERQESGELMKLGSIYHSSKFKEIEKGPYKGIYTTDYILSNIIDYQSDLDLIKENKAKLIHLENPNPMAFLYLDSNFANCFSWISPTSMSRHLKQFIDHPEKRPDLIYYSYSFQFTEEAETQEYKDFVLAIAQMMCKDICEGTITYGKKGVLLKVNNWKTDDYSFVDLIEEEENKYIEEHNINR